MRKKKISICLLSIFIIVILKIAYDSFILNSYYNHGEELIYKIEKNKMGSRVYPISLASIGIKKYKIGESFKYKSLLYSYSNVGIGDFRLSFHYGSSSYTYCSLLRKWSKNLDLDTLNVIRDKIYKEVNKIEKQNNMKQVVRLIPKSQLWKFKEFYIADTGAVYFVRKYYINKNISEEGFIKKSKGSFNRIGRWNFFTEDGISIMVSYENKDYRNGYVLKEGFPHDNIDYVGD